MAKAKLMAELMAYHARQIACADPVEHDEHDPATGRYSQRDSERFVVRSTTQIHRAFLERNESPGGFDGPGLAVGFGRHDLEAHMAIQDEVPFVDGAKDLGPIVEREAVVDAQTHDLGR